jgi:hypothetical protein
MKIYTYKSSLYFKKGLGLIPSFQTRMSNIYDNDRVVCKKEGSLLNEGMFSNKGKMFENLSFKNTKRPSLKKEEYLLETFRRSNQDTCLTHKPAVYENTWVQTGDLLTDCASSVGGELSLGQNLLIAYMPWEGYNFEDAILISERLVMDDLYTSVHIERYELETQKTKLGSEQITRNIPDASDKELSNLDSFGIIKLGSWVEEGDILVGKITPINKRKISPYQKLLYSILEKQVRPFKDSSLRAPRGIKAKVIDIKYFLKSSYKSLNKSLNKSLKAKKTNSLFSGFASLGKESSKFKNEQQYKNSLNNKGGRSKKSVNVKKGFLKTLNNLFFKKTKSFNIHFIFLRYYWLKYKKIHLLENSQKKGNRNNPTFAFATFAFFCKNKSAKAQKNSFGLFVENKKGKRIFSLPEKTYGNLIKANYWQTTTKNEAKQRKQKRQEIIQNIESIHIYLAEKRKIQVGDKMAGRHGNKGIVSQILPIQDMPYLPDGTPIDMVLNPLGVPSRMNVGQIYECLLGLAGRYLGENYKVFSFDEIYGPEASRSFVFSKLYEARRKTGFKWLFDPNSPGKIRLFDGRNGECFDQRVTVGQAYILRLVHMVDDKIHCLTPDHEVLTTDGWVFIDKVTTEHEVATLETSTGQLVYQKPLRVLNYPQYSGDLYHIKNKNIDLLVTLNHRMFVKSGRNYNKSFADYKLIEAKDIVGKHSKYLKNAKWIQDDYQFTLPAVISNSVLIPERKVDMDAWLTYFGLWIAEGWAVNNEIKENNKNNTNNFNNTADFTNVNSYLISANKAFTNVNSGLISANKAFTNVNSGLISANKAFTNVTGNLITATADLSNTAPVLNNKTPVILQKSSVFLKSTNFSTNLKNQKKAIYKVDVCQNKQRVVDVLVKAVKSLGYTYSVVDNKLTIHDKQLWTYLRPLSVGAPNKYLPSWVWQLSQTQAQKLLHALCLGDGTWRRTSVSYYTTSIKLADDVMRLALHAGWSANKHFHLPKGLINSIDGRVITSQYDVWRVSIIKGKNSPAVNQGHHKKQSCQIEEIVSSYRGSVHCLSVPNEVFYVRRNGLPVWTGNSRSTGPYSLVTQQPLRGRSKQGGQRLGEMEVWALEGYGAAFTLLEMLTIKSDDMTGRMTLWSNLILNKDISIGTPEAFKVLVCELQALCLDIGLFRNIQIQYSTKDDNQKTNTKTKYLPKFLRPTEYVLEINNLMNLP